MLNIRLHWLSGSFVLRYETSPASFFFSLPCCSQWFWKINTPPLGEIGLPHNDQKWQNPGTCPHPSAVLRRCFCSLWLWGLQCCAQQSCINSVLGFSLVFFYKGLNWTDSPSHQWRKLEQVSTLAVSGAAYLDRCTSSIWSVTDNC